MKETAKNIREAAAATRITARTFRESGALEDMDDAACGAAAAARDTTVEIRDAAKDVNKTFTDTTGIVREAAEVAQDTARVVTRELPKPKSSKSTAETQRERKTRVRGLVNLKAAKKGRKRG